MQQAPAIEPSQPVVYPESDGKPMAETDLHFDEMVALRDALEDRYRGDANVYVAGNNFLYYEEGNLKACLSPDIYVVKGVAKHQRRYFRLWEEAGGPCFVIELSSRSTWLEDIRRKKIIYRRLGGSGRVFPIRPGSEGACAAATGLPARARCVSPHPSPVEPAGRPLEPAAWPVFVA